MAEPVLECQDCGTVLLVLTPEQAQRVARNPYNYVLFCGLCRLLHE